MQLETILLTRFDTIVKILCVKTKLHNFVTTRSLLL
nr:MAG TPA: hypothetical protein [Caudoviricetes sp.]